MARIRYAGTDDTAKRERLMQASILGLVGILLLLLAGSAGMLPVVVVLAFAFVAIGLPRAA